MTIKDEIQLQYEGFCETPRLWKDACYFHINQYIFEPSNDRTFHSEKEINIRLGKRVERFLSHQLHLTKGISNIIENIQIQSNRITLGELDFVFKDGSKQIHLEVIYKFYLFDQGASESEIGKWIGPNRKDSLPEKLNKLKTKQLPRLYLQESKELLKKHQFEIEKIEQFVDFRAQLFVPYNSEHTPSDIINNACIKGVYITKDQLPEFQECQFHIPSKLNWLAEPIDQEKFISYDLYLNEIEFLLSEKRSPLCWKKSNDGTLEKFFVVWW